MAFGFPNNPSTNQVYLGPNGVRYKFDGAKWKGDVVQSEGFIGSIGFTGSSGNTGFTGSQGIQGVTGFSGSQGTQGIQGFTGSVGSQGTTGFAGSQGIQGIQGVTGFVGSKGDTGFIGSQGIQGVSGFTGSVGSQGTTGFTGSQGIQGIQGVTGFVGSQGSQNIIFSIASGSSITINSDSTDVAYQNNTQATGTLTINSPTGTPTDAQKLMLKIKSQNVQTFSWNAAFIGSTDLPLPTATSGANKVDYMGFVYMQEDSKWHMIAKNFGF
jgi:hypothetical protein